MIIYYQGEPIAYFDDNDKGWGWLVDWYYNLIKKGFSHSEIVGDLEILEKLDKYNSDAKIFCHKTLQDTFQNKENL